MEKKKLDKQNIIVLIIIAIVVLAIAGLAVVINNKPISNDCFNMSTEKFYTQLRSVVRNNSKLGNLTFDNENLIYDNDKLVGVYIINEKENKKIASVILSIDADGPTAEQYNRMMTATFLALDKKLTFDEANEISKKLDNDAIFGGSGVQKNGIQYKYIPEYNYKGRTYASWGAYPIKK